MTTSAAGESYADSTRENLIAGLRQLADWLTANPEIPVPPHTGTQVTYFVRDDTDEIGRTEVARLAGVAHAQIRDAGGHLEAVRNFGSVQWRAVHIDHQAMDDYRAVQSYDGAVHH